MVGFFKLIAILGICIQLGIGVPPGGTWPVITGGPAPVPSMVPVTGFQAEDQVKVHFIDVGQADSIYIQLPDNDDVLIDAGEVSDGPTVVEYLRQQGMDGQIELLIATHPHRDHIGGIPDVLEAFDVMEVLDSGLVAESRIYESYKESVIAEGRVWSSDDRQVYKFGAVELAILTGDEKWEGVNNNSVVARLDCGETEILFTGDAEKEAEKMLTGDIGAEILKVGHHGSASSTSAEFLARVNPEAAIISVGEGNRYGHPHGETLARLRDSGVPAYMTLSSGTMVLVVTPDCWRWD